MPHRTMCDVLEEMRLSVKTLNFAYLAGLIEEAQVMANRMESALWDQKDFKSLRKRSKKLQKEVNRLAAKKEKLESGVSP